MEDVSQREIGAELDFDKSSSLVGSESSTLTNVIIILKRGLVPNSQIEIVNDNTGKTATNFSITQHGRLQINGDDHKNPNNWKRSEEEY